MYKRFILKNLSLTDINPRVCGIYSGDPGDVWPRHHIQRHVLHYVTKGCGEYLANDKTFAVKKGDIFFCRPGYITSYKADWQEGMEYIWVSFDCTEAFASVLKQDVFEAPWARSVFEEIISCCGEPAREWAVCGRLFEFFAHLSAEQPENPECRDDYVSRALDFIHTNYPDDIRVGDLAEDLGLNRHYFCRLFKARTGLSPQNYLVNHRLKQAARLLEEEGLAQKEVALRVGYPDVYAFSRMFKRIFGVAPGAYVRERRDREK